MSFLAKIKRLLTSLLIIIPLVSSAQTLHFYDYISLDGYAGTESNSFTIDPNGSTIYCLIFLPSANQYEEELSFDIFSVDAYGNEIFERSEEMLMEAGYEIHWWEIVFSKAGHYRVKVYRLDYDPEADDIIDVFMTSADLYLSY